jgi:hypothetical protein
MDRIDDELMEIVVASVLKCAFVAIVCGLLYALWTMM